MNHNTVLNIDKSNSESNEDLSQSVDGIRSRSSQQAATLSIKCQPLKTSSSSKSGTSFQSEESESVGTMQSSRLSGGTFKPTEEQCAPYDGSSTSTASSINGTAGVQKEWQNSLTTPATNEQRTKSSECTRESIKLSEEQQQSTEVGGICCQELPSARSCRGNVSEEVQSTSNGFKSPEEQLGNFQPIIGRIISEPNGEREFSKCDGEEQPTEAIMGKGRISISLQTERIEGAVSEPKNIVGEPLAISLSERKQLSQSVSRRTNEETYGSQKYKTTPSWECSSIGAPICQISAEGISLQSVSSRGRDSTSRASRTTKGYSMDEQEGSVSDAGKIKISKKESNAGVKMGSATPIINARSTELFNERSAASSANDGPSSNSRSIFTNNEGSEQINDKRTDEAFCGPVTSPSTDFNRRISTVGRVSPRSKVRSPCTSTQRSTTQEISSANTAGTASGATSGVSQSDSRRTVSPRGRSPTAAIAGLSPSAIRKSPSAECAKSPTSTSLRQPSSASTPDRVSSREYGGDSQSPSTLGQSPAASTGSSQSRTSRNDMPTMDDGSPSSWNGGPSNWSINGSAKNGFVGSSRTCITSKKHERLSSDTYGRTSPSANVQPPELASGGTRTTDELQRSTTQACIAGESLPTSSSGSNSASCMEQRRTEGHAEQEGWQLGPDEGEATPTKEDAKGILAIDKKVVHQICSGQVVVSLATAVKELVENSLDAGSRSVEVRLTDYGSTSVVVSDDGPGVHPRDYEALALKHHTSKLRDFGDLSGVATFGFRGEALSSLCALSKVTVCTRHRSQAVGTNLVYDHNGRVDKQATVARKVGTTVTLSGLFSTLPVRRKEFERHLKKDYHKMLQVMYSYAIIATNVRLLVSQQAAGGRRQTVLHTSGHTSFRDNLTAVYGVKMVSGLLPLEHSSEDSSFSKEMSLKKAAVADGVVYTLRGLISSCRHGAGRSAPDRQHYYVNSRPCDPVKVSRVVNEVYHAYNRHQYPVVVLDVSTTRDAVDVNLTPDKRQVLLHHEAMLLALIKSSLHQLYEDIPHTVHLNQLTSSSPSILSSSFSSPPITPSLRSTKQTTVLYSSFSGSSPKSGSTALIPQTQSADSAFAHNSTNPINVHLPQDDSSFDKLQNDLTHEKAIVNTNMYTNYSPLCNKTSASPYVHSQNTLSSFIETNPVAIFETPCPLETPAAAYLSEHKKNSPSTIASKSPLIGGGSTKSSKVSLSARLCMFRCPSSITQQPLLPPHSLTPEAANTGDAHQTSASIFSESCHSSKRASTNEGHPSPKKKQPRLDLKLCEDKENASIQMNCCKDTANLLVSDSPTLHSITETQVAHDVSQVFNQSTLKDKDKCAEEFMNKLRTKKINTSNSSSVVSGVRNSLKKFQRFSTTENKDKGPGIDSGTSNEGGCVSGQYHDEDIDTEFDIIEVEKTMTQFKSSDVDYDNENCLENVDVKYDDEIPGNNVASYKKEKVILFSVSKLRENLAKINEGKSADEQTSLVRNFHAKIAPSDNQAAENELKKVLSKDMFANMDVLGQFNLGFILTRLKSDLFIIDQHATDEKYNFETLQKTCILRHQPLISLQSLDLTPANESILMDNLEIFTANGFEFDIDETRPFGQRVKLKSVPQSRNWSFGKDDIEELIFMLSDSAGSMCRPSRVRSMFASRACRTSVMVGTALSVGKMRELVDHMGQIEQPWNCPHGRPTVRHLLSLDMLVTNEDGKKPIS